MYLAAVFIINKYLTYIQLEFLLTFFQLIAAGCDLSPTKATGNGDKWKLHAAFQTCSRDGCDACKKTKERYKSISTATERALSSLFPLSAIVLCCCFCCLRTLCFLILMGFWVTIYILQNVATFARHFLFWEFFNAVCLLTWFASKQKQSKAKKILSEKGNGLQTLIAIGN